jgi:hypothetical protein
MIQTRRTPSFDVTLSRDCRISAACLIGRSFYLARLTVPARRHDAKKLSSQSERADCAELVFLSAAYISRVTLRWMSGRSLAGAAATPVPGDAGTEHMLHRTANRAARPAENHRIEWLQRPECDNRQLFGMLKSS